MKIEKIKIIQINPAPYNPRKDLKPGDATYEKLKVSMDTFGYVDPIIWNSRTGNLVGGHQRFKILMAQGADEVEASIVDLPLEQEKTLNLALNKIQGEWDEDKLASLLDEMTKLPDFNIDSIGFDMPEISNILDDYRKSQDADVVPDLEAITNPITQKGDLIILGTHRLLCGDSSNPDDMAKLLNGHKANLVFSDPPYNVDYYGGNRPTPETSRPKPSKDWNRIYNDNLTQAEYELWLEQVFKNMMPHLAEGAPFYIWNGHRQFGPMYQIMAGLGLHISCVITWAKERFAIGYGDYNQQTEFCLYGWKEDNGAHNWYGPTNESTLWQIDRELTSAYEHPTQKPVTLAEKAIKNSSTRCNVVLDMFLGSGTTLIAAERLERTCYGMEIDPCYCDVIVKRYIGIAGKDKVSDDVKARYLKEINNG